MTKLRFPFGLFPLVVGGVLLLAISLQAQNTVHYDAVPGGAKIKVDGTSTLHDWTVETQAVGGFMELDPAFDADLKTLNGTPKVEVTVPIRQMKNTEGKKSMDNVMYEHMNMKDNPIIKYHLVSLAAKPGAAQFDAKGELTVSGVTRTNTMPVTFERIDKSKIKVKGTTNFKMTDFGIKPPALTVVGIGIKTGDDIKLAFEWTAAQPEKTADAK